MGTATLSNYVTDSDNSRSFTGFLYQLWDAQKIQGCKCDLGYSGPDCASRVAPKGDDPLTTVKSAMMTQSVSIGSTTDPSAAADFAGDEFFIIYHQLLPVRNPRRWRLCGGEHTHELPHGFPGHVCRQAGPDRRAEPPGSGGHCAQGYQHRRGRGAFPMSDGVTS